MVDQFKDCKYVHVYNRTYEDLVKLLTKLYNKKLKVRKFVEQYSIQSFVEQLKQLFNKYIKKKKPKKIVERYDYLARFIYNYKCKTIVEIGVYNGNHAKSMIETAKEINPNEKIKYYGFDLFELLTDELLNKEHSIKPSGYQGVTNKLNKTGADVKLYKGFTKNTLPEFVTEVKNNNIKVDFVFIDGGHSIETIENDWKYVKQIINKDTIVLFDDYYNNTEKEVQPFGCNKTIEAIDKNIYDVKILDIQDKFPRNWGSLNIKMVRVKLK